MNQIYTCDKCKQQYQITQSGEYQCQCGETFTIAPLAICPFCKSEVDLDALKCPHCGEWIKEKPKSMLIYVLLCIFLPTGLLGCGEFYIGRKKIGTFVLILSLTSMICTIRSMNGVECDFSNMIAGNTPFIAILLFCIFLNGCRYLRQINQPLTKENP